ncbi:Dynein regulatory complex subunit 7 [Podila minutissima]|uniref:Dynein regulatory complex subunit 7 n=1 Tax=Podila minutissima TaxID=64525 RepID=A0A9P5S9K3_9FUNG|nr:Dynein regulatory complex subunit 7 [Podila minutissima]
MAAGSNSFLTTLLIFTLLSNTLFANAQSYIPESTRGSVSAFIDGKAMYVHGGYNNLNDTISQSFSLDLSTSWDVATPAYKKLPDGVKSGYNPGALLNDSTTLFILADNSYYYYNVHNGQLTGFNPGSSNTVNATNSGNQAATNPKTGRVYVPYGYYGYFDSRFSLLRFDPDAKKIDSVKQPAEFLTLDKHSISWSERLDAMLMFAGVYPKTGQMTNSLYRYNYADGSWTLLPTTGDVPSPRYGACFTPVAGGRSMVVFGGDTAENVTLRDIYVLDVTTWKWTRGHDAPLEDARAGAACAVSNDMFVAFAGYVRNPYFNNNPRLLVVYSLSTNSWVDKFTYTPLPNGSGSGSGSRSNLGAIIGGAAAGCVVLLGIIIYMVRRRRKSKDTKPAHDAVKPSPPFLSNPKPTTQTTITHLNPSTHQQPSYVPVQTASSMPVVFTPQPPTLLQHSVALSPVSIPATNYHQQLPQTTYQIPIVYPQNAPYPQQPNHQQQHQQPALIEQRHEQQQEHRQQEELDKQRVKEAQLEQDIQNAHQAEERMSRLHVLKDQRQVSVGSPVYDERYSPGGPQVAVPNPVAPPVKDEDELYVRPPSTAVTWGEGRNPHAVQPHMNLQYTMPVEREAHVYDRTVAGNPQQRD